MKIDLLWKKLQTFSILHYIKMLSVMENVLYSIFSLI
jgi:hypothetical protein